jgi:soluble lytic murein transglycosylase-like protein
MAVGGAAKTLLAVTISLHPAAAHHDGRHVTVRPGDSLSSISKRVYGRAADWPALWWANRHAVPNPSMIRAGQRLHVTHWHRVKPWLRHAALSAIPAPAAQPVSTTAAAGTGAPAAQPPGSYGGVPGSFQACVIQAESGGNPAAVNPYSGAGGLYGFLPSTWQSLGFSGLPENAPVSVQNAAFAKEYALVGTSAWAPYDGC